MNQTCHKMKNGFPSTLFVTYLTCSTKGTFADCQFEASCIYSDTDSNLVRKRGSAFLEVMEN